MKKLAILLALVFVLGIAGTAAAAANPFVDVPANHWAYKAVQQLYDAGIVKGTGDKRFRGQQTMTRYEMAQIVAQAMAAEAKADKETKALIDKLQVEFSDELSKLGVRVAALEKKVGSVKVSGDVRIRYTSAAAGVGNTTGDVHSFQERFRVYFKGDVNDSLSWFGRLNVDNNNNFGDTDKISDETAVTAAYMTQKFGNGDLTVDFGRFGESILATRFFMDTEGKVDGVRANVKFGEGGLLEAGYANFTAADNPLAWNYKKNAAGTVDNITDNAPIGTAVFAQVMYPFFDKKLTLGAFYLNELKDANQVSTGPDTNYNLYGFGASYVINDNWLVRGDYMVNNKTVPVAATVSASQTVDNPKGYVVQLVYNKGMNIPIGEPGPANATKFGDYRLLVGYHSADAGLAPAVGTTQIDLNSQINARGWAAQFDLALGKNFLWQNIYYFNTKQQTYTGDTQPDKPSCFRTQFQIAF